MLYTLCMNNKIVKCQRETLEALSGKIDNFYLAGGTALSLFYFQHRMSIDLDFFTQDFNAAEIVRISEYLSGALGRKVEPIGRKLDAKTAKMLVYNIHFPKDILLKIDFVEDVIKLLKETISIEGIRVLSLEDIFLRKLYALLSRIDAKDFYDVYHLSHTFMPLSRFIQQYCNQIMMEDIIKWYKSYDRMAMIDGVLELASDKRPDYKKMERHFKKEINEIIENEIG